MRIPKFRYVLEKYRNSAERNQPEMIHAHVSYGNYQMSSSGRKKYVPVKISLQQKILPKNFGMPEDNFAFNSNVFEKFSRSNRGVKNTINQFEKIVFEAAEKYPINVIPNKDEFKKDILERLNRLERIDYSNLPVLDFVEEEIERYENESQSGTEGSLDDNTIKTYRTIRTLVLEYQSATSETLTFQNLDADKYRKFWDTLDAILRDEIKLTEKIRSKAQAKQPHGYMVNTIRKYQDALIKTINSAKDKYKITPALDTTRTGLKNRKADSSKSFYISEEELDVILNSEVSYDDGLQLAKDFLVMSCLTGMRFQSMQDSSKQIVQEINTDGYQFKYFHSYQNKTKTEVYMPILKPVLEIINRNDGLLPKWNSNGDMNKKLKVFSEVIGLDSQVTETLVTYKMGKVEVSRPKYELVSTHDGRKSFITNLAKLGANQTVVDDMTHPDKKPPNAMNRVYIKMTLIDKAKKFVDEIEKLDSKIYTLG